MKKWHVSICLALWLGLVSGGAAAWAQESADTPAEETAQGEADDDDAGDDEDIFTPSEAIEADTEISFPADI